MQPGRRSAVRSGGLARRAVHRPVRRHARGQRLLKDKSLRAAHCACRRLAARAARAVFRVGADPGCRARRAHRRVGIRCGHRRSRWRGRSERWRHDRRAHDAFAAEISGDVLRGARVIVRDLRHRFVGMHPRASEPRLLRLDQDRTLLLRQKFVLKQYARRVRESDRAHTSDGEGRTLRRTLCVFTAVKNSSARVPHASSTRSSRCCAPVHRSASASAARAQICRRLRRRP